MGGDHETNVQASEPPSSQQARFQGSYEYALGTGSPEPTAQKGPQETRCVHPVETREWLTHQRLPRHWRLSRGADVRAVTLTGQRCRYPRLDLAWRANDCRHPRVGVIVPRYGNTVVARNKVRRRLRECARRAILPKLSAVDLVVRARPAAYGAGLTELASDLTSWLQSIST